MHIWCHAHGTDNWCNHAGVHFLRKRGLRARVWSPVLSVLHVNSTSQSMTALQTAACCKGARATFLNGLACVQEAACLQEHGSPSDLIHPSAQHGILAARGFWCSLLPRSELVCRSVYCTAVFNIDTHLMTLQNPPPCKFWNGDYCAVTQKHAFRPFTSLLWVTGRTSVRPSVNILKALNKILKFILQCKDKQSGKDSNVRWMLWPMYCQKVKAKW